MLVNAGNATLSISGITIGGTNPGDFAQTNSCSSSLAAGASCAISVTFTPPTTGSRSASLSVIDNATGSPQTVSLTGTGALGPLASLSPTTLAFGVQAWATTSAPQIVTLSNTGTSPLSISGITINGGVYFLETDNCSGGVAAGSNCAINVAFQPWQTGPQTGTLIVSDNSINGSPQLVSLSGTGGVAPGNRTLSVYGTVLGANDIHGLDITVIFQ